MQMTIEKATAVLTTVNTTTSSQRFHGSGSTGPFTFSWRFLDNDDIAVYRVDDPDEGNPENWTELTEGTDYTLSGAGSYTGGSLTLTAALATGKDLAIERTTPALQETDIRNQGNNFFPEIHEDTFDKIVMMLQDLLRVGSRKLQFPIGDTTIPVLAAVGARAGNFLAFDNDGKLTYLSALLSYSGQLVQNYDSLRAIDTASLADKTPGIVQFRSSKGDGGGGTFYWDASDLSAEVAADTQSGIYVAPNSDSTGASGAWVRQYSGAVNVRWFGADGDGTTDDTAAIRAAFAFSKNLFFSAGVYIVDGSDTGVLLIVDANGVSLRGEGFGVTRLQGKPGATGFTWIKGDDSARANVAINGLWFYGNAASRGTGEDYFIWANNADSWNIEQCKFEDARSTSTASKAIIISAGSVDVMVRNNFFSNNGGEDINFYGADGAIFRCSAIGNHHHQPQGPAIEIEGRNGTTISGYEVRDITISGNTIRSTAASYGGAGAEGILVIGGRGVNISDNIINRRGEHGIKVIGTHNIAITNNVIKDMGNTGKNGVLFTIDVFGGDGGSINASIIGNIIDACNSTGINAYPAEAAGSPQNFTVVNNIITNCVDGIQLNDIQHLVLTGNSYRSNSGNNISLGTMTGNLAITDADNTTTQLALPYINHHKTIDHTTGGTLTLPLGEGHNVFSVWLNDDVTSVDVTGTPKLGQRLRLIFVQAAGSKTVTTTVANWTTNSTTNFRFENLAVPGLPGSTLSGRWGAIEFEFAEDTAGGGANGKWIHVNHILNVGS
jgi:hypothetical protein